MFPVDQISIKRPVFNDFRQCQLAIQAIGVVVVAAFVLTTTGILFSILKKVGLLRVSAEEEMEGLDTIEHGTPGYHDDVMALEGMPGSSASSVYEKV